MPEGRMEGLPLHGRVSLTQTVLAVLAAAVLLVSVACRKGTEAPKPKGGQPPAAPGGEATTQSLAAVKLYAEVSKSLAPRISSDAGQAFSAALDPQKRWSTPEAMTLDYYHAAELLASLAHADGLSSSSAVMDMLPDLLFGEYNTRLFRRDLKEIPVSDKEIEEYYKAHLKEYIVKGQFWIRHIFLNTVDNPGREKEKEALAQKALAEIKAGRPFHEVAKQYTDADQEKGEVVGPLPYGDINPDLEKAVAALEPGHYTDVIQSKWGYNIFWLEKIERPTTKTVEMVRDSITQQLRREKTRTAYQQYFTQMEQRYPVKKNYDVLKDPNATSDTVVAEGSYIRITVGDYRKRINQMPTPRRLAMGDPENRTGFLDGWVAGARVQHAAKEVGLDRDPELQEVKRYLTNRTLSTACLDRLLANLPAPKEEEIRKYYEDYRDYFVSKQEEVRLREIVFSYKLGEGATKRDYYLAMKKAKARADEAYAKLKEGADFVALVKQHSNSESAKKDGDLGFLNPRQWSADLADKLATVKVGDFTQPIEARETYTIFRLEERKPAELVPLNEPRKQYIHEVLLNQQRRKLSALIVIKLAEVYRKDMPVEEIRKIVERVVAEAGEKK